MKPFLLSLTGAVLCAFLAPASQAAVKPVNLFSDDMVLQQGIPNPVWGAAAPGETVQVSIAGQTQTTQADVNGNWAVKLAPLQAGGPFEMNINERTVKNVLVGEVWLASGQSNMQWPVQKSQNAEAEIAASADPQLRMFTFGKAVAAEPQTRVSGAWKEANPTNTGGFSAAAYFFARELRRELKVPVGIVHASRGGTPAEAWTSRAALEKEPALKERLAYWDKLVADYPAAKQKYEAETLPAWQTEADKAKAEGKPMPRKPEAPEGAPGDASVPASLFNAMINPLIPYGIKGVIWYQGEANTSLADEYRALFPTLIRDWRSRWGQPEMPFLWVQLANHGRKQTLPVEGGWARIRESQTMALALPNTGMVIITDTSTDGNLHPPEKQPVGQRLALAALALGYKKNLEYSGPLYDSMKVEGNKIRIKFTHVGGGLEAKGGKLEGFAIAGADKKFAWGEAEIEGDTVVVSNPSINNPIAVRYDWASNPIVSLYNKEGLPASSFRTDPEDN